MAVGLRRIDVFPDAARPSAGLLVAAGVRFRCALGRSGVTAEKREGDGATPLGDHRLVRVLYRPDHGPRPRTGLPVTPIAPDSGWCDDPADRAYNRPVSLPYPARHERLWRDDRVYDLVVVLGWNLDRPEPGRGSAIFLHLAAPSWSPTAGCVAVDLPAMRRLLAFATPDTILRVSR